MRRIAACTLAIPLIAALSACGPDTERIRRDLREGDEEERKSALEFARRMQRPDLAPDVLPLLEDESSRVRKLAARALEWLQNPEILAELAAAAESNAEMREEILDIIYQLDDPDSLPMLQRFTQHEDAAVARKAGEYIAAINEHLNADIVFHSLGKPPRSRLAQLIETMATETGISTGQEPNE